VFFNTIKRKKEKCLSVEAEAKSKAEAEGHTKAEAKGKIKGKKQVRKLLFLLLCSKTQDKAKSQRLKPKKNLKKGQKRLFLLRHYIALGWCGCLMV